MKKLPISDIHKQKRRKKFVKSKKSMEKYEKYVILIYVAANYAA